LYERSGPGLGVRWRTALGKGCCLWYPWAWEEGHSPHRPLQHLIRWKCCRFVIIVLPWSEAEYERSVCVLANVLEYRWNTGKLM